MAYSRPYEQVLRNEKEGGYLRVPDGTVPNTGHGLPAREATWKVHVGAT